MITDDELYQLAIFLGSCAMLLIILYHYLEVNAKDSTPLSSSSSVAGSSENGSSSGKAGSAVVAGTGGASSGVASSTKKG